MKPILAVTPGDPEGIGPEIVWKSARRFGKSLPAQLLCVGARKPFDEIGATIVEAVQRDDKILPIKKKPRGPFIWLLSAPTQPPPSSENIFLPGYQSGWSIQTATRLVLSGGAEALVTGPISKERLRRGGFQYSGHTDFLADLCGAPSVTMMLANEQLKVTLVTTHLSIKEVPEAICRESIRRTITQTHEHLKRWWGIKKPKIAIAALNPHAGESGLFGKEEKDVISPEMSALQNEHPGEFHILGPLPSDTLFAKNFLAKPDERYDAVICMYHDQGLIPVKLLDFRRTVNVTLGLPIVRTSVDHGVGFDIARTGKADPSSFQSAVKLALRLVKNRNRYLKGRK